MLCMIPLISLGDRSWVLALVGVVVVLIVLVVEAIIFMSVIFAFMSYFGYCY